MRYYSLDRFRGITVISMILYHMVWDLVYLFGINWTWYETPIAYVWQQSICWTFILLSGFSWSFGRHKIKRGLTVFLAGWFITGAMALFMPEQTVVFGVLTLLGSCMIFMVPLEKVLSKVPAALGIAGSLFLFFLFRNVNEGWLGFESLQIMKLPEFLYANMFTTYLGFPMQGFYSTDYFAILPWIFLFIAGYFLYRYVKENGKLECFSESRSKVTEWIGRHSMPIYLLHQPVLYAVLSLIF